MHPPLFAEVTFLRIAENSKIANVTRIQYDLQIAILNRGGIPGTAGTASAVPLFSSYNFFLYFMQYSAIYLSLLAPIRSFTSSIH